MAYNMDYDAALNILYTAYPGEHLRTEAEVDVYFEKVYTKMKSLGKKVYIITNLDDFSVDPAVSTYYADGLKKLIERYVIMLYRYNVKAGMPSLTIRLASLQANTQSNIYPSREAALDALTEARKKK